MNVLDLVAMTGRAVETPTCTLSADHVHATTSGGTTTDNIFFTATSNDSGALTWEVGWSATDTNWDGLTAITQPTAPSTASISTVTGAWGNSIAVSNALGWGGSVFAPTTPQRYIFYGRVLTPDLGLWGVIATGGIGAGASGTAYQPNGSTVIPRT